MAILITPPPPLLPSPYSCQVRTAIYEKLSLHHVYICIPSEYTPINHVHAIICDMRCVYFNTASNIENEGAVSTEIRRCYYGFAINK